MHTDAFSVLLHRALEARIGRLLELTAVEGWRQDAASLHDVRVASRRVRAVMELVDPTSYPKFKRHQRKLKTLTRALSGPREWDVHLEILESMKGLHPEIASFAAIEHAQEALERSRRRIHRRMERDLSKTSLESLSKLLRISTLAELFAQPFIQGDVQESACTCLEPRLQTVQDLIPGATAKEDAVAMHELRIRVKKARYLLEIISPGLGESNSMLECLRELQTILGEHHDLSTLEAHLQSLHERLAKRKRTHLAAGIFDILGFLAEKRRTAFDRFCELALAFTPTSFLAQGHPEASE